MTDCIPLRRDPNDLPSGGGEEISVQTSGESGSNLAMAGENGRNESEQVAESISGGCDQRAEMRRPGLWLWLVLGIWFLKRRFRVLGVVRHGHASLIPLLSILCSASLISCHETEDKIDSEIAGESFNDPFSINGCSQELGSVMGKMMIVMVSSTTSLI